MVAAFAMVIGAFDGDFARDRQPGFGSVVNEAGVCLTVGANATGPEVPLFLPASRPA